MKYSFQKLASILAIVVSCMSWTPQRARAQITQDFSVHTYTMNGNSSLYDSVSGATSQVTGQVYGPSVFLSQSSGNYRMRGIALTSAANLAIPGEILSSSSGVSLRLVIGPGNGGVPTTAPVSMLSLSAGSTGPVLSIGHDDRAWLVGRSGNTSPKNPTLLPNLLWTTPWDPIYEVGAATMIMYYRIDPNGVAYLDRFVPYYDSNHTVQVSWEEGVQQGVFTMGNLKLGTDNENPAPWSPLRFSALTVGTGSAMLDEVRDATFSKSYVGVAAMLADVVSLVPGVVLSQPDLLPCNDGQWLINNVNQTQSGTTPCGLFLEYTPSITDTVGNVRFGPPAGRLNYKSGTTDTFLPHLTEISGSLKDGKETITWTPQGRADGYDYYLLDNGTWVAGGTLTAVSYTFQPMASHSYTFTVAAYTPMGVSDPLSISTGAVPPSSPTNLVLTPSTGQITATWGPPLNGEADHYAAKVFDADALVASRDPVVSPTQFTGLVDGKVYRVEITAVNSFGASSPAVGSMSSGTLTGPPSHLVVTPDKGQLKLSWEAPLYQTAPPTSYLVNWTANNGTNTSSFLSGYTTTPSGVFTTTITNLPPVWVTVTVLAATNGIVGYPATATGKPWQPDLNAPIPVQKLPDGIYGIANRRNARHLEYTPIVTPKDGAYQGVVQMSGSFNSQDWWKFTQRSDGYSIESTTSPINALGLWRRYDNCLFEVWANQPYDKSYMTHFGMAVNQAGDYFVYALWGDDQLLLDSLDAGNGLPVVANECKPHVLTDQLWLLFPKDGVFSAGKYEITNRSSNLSIQVTSPDNRAPVTQNAITTQANQQWYISNAGKGGNQYWLVNMWNGLALDNSGQQNNGPLYTMMYVNNDYQRWLFNLTSDGTFEIKNAANGLCLDMPNSSKGTQLLQQGCNGSGNQRWIIQHRD